MKLCKRNHVYAYSQNTCTINHNLTECTGVRHHCGCIHAEQSLINMKTNIDFIMVSRSPCLECAKKLLEAGIKTLVYRTLHSKQEGLDYLKENGVFVYCSYQHPRK